MRLTKPISHKELPRNLRRARRRWDDADNQSLAIGCYGCADRGPCGGIHKKQDHYSCLDDCCGNPSACDQVCPRNLVGFRTRLREVDGFGLENISRAPVRPAPHVPSYIPLVYHGNRRAEPLLIEAAAIPLQRLYSRKTKGLRYRSRAEIAAAFRLADTVRILAVGSGRDKGLETWWGLSDLRREIAVDLAGLGLEMATSPNFSLFTDQTRYNDMHNIKRIGIAWQELLAGGLPCALHLNCRTKRDYERLTEFIFKREEVTDVVFEFGTGAARPGRRGFHHQHLAALARDVGRPLHLTIIGGAAAIPTLAPAFERLTFVDTTPFMKAMHRKLLVEGNDLELVETTARTDVGAPLDALIARNIEARRGQIERLISASRARKSADDSLPMQEIRERTVSAPTAPPSARDAVRQSLEHGRRSEIVGSH